MPHPRMYDDAHPAIGKLRELCLALPDTFEKEAWGECTFRVRGGSMFAMTDNNHHDSGHLAVWLKAPAMVQEIMVRSDPERFFIPPYVGKKGWVGIVIDAAPAWDEIAGMLKDAHSLSSPGNPRAGGRNKTLARPKISSSRRRKRSS
jgi:predicted DNA-binding protein (MmcQ/YjbR family)